MLEKLQEESLPLSKFLQTAPSYKDIKNFYLTELRSPHAKTMQVCHNLFYHFLQEKSRRLNEAGETVSYQKILTETFDRSKVNPFELRQSFTTDKQSALPTSASRLYVFKMAKVLKELGAFSDNEYDPIPYINTIYGLNHLLIKYNQDSDFKQEVDFFEDMPSMRIAFNTLADSCRKEKEKTIYHSRDNHYTGGKPTRYSGFSEHTY